MTGRATAVGLRIAQTLPVLVGFVVISFILTRALPGDPAAFFAGQMADAASIEETRVKLGLDKPLVAQFFLYAGDLLQGDLGRSANTGRPVLTDLSERLPASLELTLSALVVSCLLAVPLGIWAAVRQGSWVDHLCRVVVTAGVSLPTFFTGIVLICVFYYLLGWGPSPLGRLDFIYMPPPHVTGFYLLDSLFAGDAETFFATVRQFCLPALTLTLFTLAPIARMTRAAMLTALSADYIRTGRAAGLPPRKVLYGYAFRNALLPVVTTLCMVFSFVLGANVLVEKVFAWPGIGSYAVEALVASDYTAVQGFVLAMAVLFVVLNLMIDLSYAVIDPRIGFGSK